MSSPTFGTRKSALSFKRSIFCPAPRLFTTSNYPSSTAATAKSLPTKRLRSKPHSGNRRVTLDILEFDKAYVSRATSGVNPHDAHSALILSLLDSRTFAFHAIQAP